MARNGAGVVHLSIFHNDIEEFINSKKVNADEKLRLKTLSTAIIIPDKFMELLSDSSSRYYYTFYPKNVYDVTGVELADMDMTEWYDKLVENRSIKKTQRDKLRIVQEIVKSQKESGYSYITFIDTMNREHNLSKIGKIEMSNLCQEIAQLQTRSEFDNNLYSGKNKFGYDVQCVLSSLNLVNLFTGDISEEDKKNVIISSMKFLSNVSDMSNLESVPSVVNANKNLHSVGLGALGLNTLFVKYGIEYESEEAKDLTNLLFSYIRFYSLYGSMLIAKERGKFKDFEKSDYADGKALEKYINGTIKLVPQTEKVKDILSKIDIVIPNVKNWSKLREDIMEYGLYNAYQLTLAPNQSSAYIMEVSPSVAPVSSEVEFRDYGYLQTVYPMPLLTNENKHLYKSAYDIDQKKMLDLVRVMQDHIDQAISIVININSDTTMKEHLGIIVYAWKIGIKTLYYWRTRKQSIMADKEPICESCSV